MSTLYVDTINEKTSGNGIYIPGHVIQVVQGQSNGQQFKTTVLNTYQDIGLQVNITPSSSSSKILINYYSAFVGFNIAHMNTRLLRGSSPIQTEGMYFSGAHWTGAVPNAMVLDSPSTTSTLTYKVQGYQNSGTANYHATWHYNSNTSHIIAMEIGG